MGLFDTLKEKVKESIADQKEAIAKQKVIDDQRFAEQREKKEILLALYKENRNNVFHNTGKYLYGIPELINPTKISFLFTKDFICICNLNNLYEKEYCRINYSDITDISMEDASTIEKRVTATRLLTIGVFAFAAKKKDKHSMFYVNLKWKIGNLNQETVFEFEGKHSMREASLMKDKIFTNVNNYMQSNQ